MIRSPWSLALQSLSDRSSRSNSMPADQAVEALHPAREAILQALEEALSQLPAQMALMVTPYLPLIRRQLAVLPLSDLRSWLDELLARVGRVRELINDDECDPALADTGRL